MIHLLRFVILAALLAGCASASTPEPPTSAGARAATPTRLAPPRTLRPTTVRATSSPPPRTPTPLPPPPPTAPPSPPPPATVAPTMAAWTNGRTLGGTLSVPVDVALPADAVLTVQLRQGSPGLIYAPVGSDQRIPLQSGAISFTYAYAEAEINPNLAYSLVAEVRAGDRRLLTGAVRAIDQGVASPIVLPLYPVPTAGAVSGSIAYPGGEQPAGSVLTVQLQTPIDGVGGPLVLSEQQITPNPGGRAVFSLPIDSSQIDPYKSYQVHATMTAPGRLTQWQEERTLTYGAPATLDLAITPHADARTLGGTALLPDGVTLPADAVVSVQIAYLSHGTIGSVSREHRFAPGGAGPLPFLIEYLPESFYPNQSYALYASVRQGPKLLFTTPLLPLDPAALPVRIDLSLQAPTTIQRVTGTISVPQGAILPADASLSIQLADMRFVGGDGSPVIVAEQRIAPIDPGPISFAIEYDPLAIDSRTGYAMLATVSVGGQQLLGAAPAFVITKGAPSQVDLDLTPSN